MPCHPRDPALQPRGGCGSAATRSSHGQLGEPEQQGHKDGCDLSLELQRGRAGQQGPSWGRAPPGACLLPGKRGVANASQWRQAAAWGPQPLWTERETGSKSQASCPPPSATSSSSGQLARNTSPQARPALHTPARPHPPRVTWWQGSPSSLCLELGKWGLGTLRSWVGGGTWGVPGRGRAAPQREVGDADAEAGCQLVVAPPPAHPRVSLPPSQRGSRAWTSLPPTSN